MKTTIEFPEGIPGFESIRTCTIERVDEGPFYVLEEKGGELSLVLLDPEAFFHEYRLEASLEDLNAIGLTDEADAQVLVVATLAEHLQDIRVNLKAPIVMNKQNAKACQIIDAKGRYESRVPLFAGE
ncbi:flagellar assembly protein FliW [Tumebacillus avium]|nr:flagellar assembly protein FliW [Tumebacillus avium]